MRPRYQGNRSSPVRRWSRAKGRSLAGSLTEHHHLREHGPITVPAFRVVCWCLPGCVRATAGRIQGAYRPQHGALGLRRMFALLFAPRPTRPSPQDPEKHETRSVERVSLSSGGRIRTCDLRVMSPTSYQTAPPRVAPHVLAKSLPCQKPWALNRTDSRAAPAPARGASPKSTETTSTSLALYDPSPCARP